MVLKFSSNLFAIPLDDNLQVVLKFCDSLIYRILIILYLIIDLLDLRSAFLEKPQFVDPGVSQIGYLF